MRWAPAPRWFLSDISASHSGGGNLESASVKWHQNNNNKKLKILLWGFFLEEKNLVFSPHLILGNSWTISDYTIPRKIQPETHTCMAPKIPGRTVRDWQRHKQLNTRSFNRKCWTTSQEVLVLSTPQAGYKEATLPFLDLQLFFSTQYVICFSSERRTWHEDGCIFL